MGTVEAAALIGIYTMAGRLVATYDLAEFYAVRMRRVDAPPPR